MRAAGADAIRADVTPFGPAHCVYVPTRHVIRHPLMSLQVAVPMAMTMEMGGIRESVDEVHRDAVTAMTTRLPRSPRDSLPFLRGMLHQREQRSHLPEAERRDLLVASVHGCPQIIM